MNRLPAAFLLLTCLVPAIVLAQAPQGIYTSCTRDSLPMANDTIFAARSAGNGMEWSYCVTGYTGWQNWPPNQNIVRWGASVLGAPRIVLDTGWHYSFLAKHPTGGSAVYYSEWSEPFRYDNTNLYSYIPIQLEMDRETPPAGPEW